MTRSQAYRQMAGYLSTFKAFENMNPGTLLPLAAHVIEGATRIGLTPPGGAWESDMPEIDPACFFEDEES